MSQPCEIERALVICAHPDDVDFGSGGTVAAWTDSGIKVTYCLVTSGDAGGSDLRQSFEERARIREQEQTNAAKILGVTDLRFLRRPDGRVVSDLDLRRDLTRVIRELRPDRVLTQSSERNLDRIYASHPDHLATGDAAISAVYPDARNPFAYPELLEVEGLEPWTVPELWIMGGPSCPPHAAVHSDITATIDRKIAALRAHRSQTAHREDLEEMVRTWAAMTAEAAGLAEGRLVESFRRVDCR